MSTTRVTVRAITVGAGHTEKWRILTLPITILGSYDDEDTCSDDPSERAHAASEHWNCEHAQRFD